MTTWTLVVLMLTSPGSETRYAGFASQDECAHSQPYISTNGYTQVAPAATAFCVPDLAAAPPPMTCLDLCEATWQAGGISSTTLAECRTNCAEKLP